MSEGDEGQTGHEFEPVADTPADQEAGGDFGDSDAGALEAAGDTEPATISGSESLPLGDGEGAPVEPPAAPPAEPVLDPRIAYEPHPLLAKALSEYYLDRYSQVDTLPSVDVVIADLRAVIEQLPDYDSSDSVNEDSIRFVAEDYVERRSLGAQVSENPEGAERVLAGIGRARDTWRGIRTLGASILWSKVAAKYEKYQGKAGLVIGGGLSIGAAYGATKLIPGLRNIAYGAMGFFMGQKASYEALNNRELRSDTVSAASFGPGLLRHYFNRETWRDGWQEGRAESAQEYRDTEKVGLSRVGVGVLNGARFLLQFGLSPVTNLAKAWQINLAERRLTTDEVKNLPIENALEQQRVEKLAAYLQYRIDRRIASGEKVPADDPDMQLLSATMERFALMDEPADLKSINESWNRPSTTDRHKYQARVHTNKVGRSLVIGVLTGALGGLMGVGLTKWQHAHSAPAQAEGDVGTDSPPPKPAAPTVEPKPVAPEAVPAGTAAAGAAGTAVPTPEMPPAAAPSAPTAPKMPNFTPEHNNLTDTLTEHQHHVFGVNSEHADAHDGHIIRRELAARAQDADGNTLLTSHNEQTNEWQFNHNLMDRWHITIHDGQLDLSDVTEEGAKALHTAAYDLMFDRDAGGTVEAAMNHVYALRLESLNHNLLETLRTRVGIGDEALHRAGFGAPNSELGKFLQAQEAAADKFLHGQTVDGIKPAAAGNVVENTRGAMTKWLDAKMQHAVSVVGRGNVDSPEQAFRVSLHLEKLPDSTPLPVNPNQSHNPHGVDPTENRAEHTTQREHAAQPVTKPAAQTVTKEPVIEVEAPHSVDVHTPNEAPRVIEVEKPAPAIDLADAPKPVFAPDRPEVVDLKNHIVLENQVGANHLDPADTVDQAHPGVDHLHDSLPIKKLSPEPQPAPAPAPAPAAPAVPVATHAAPVPDMAPAQIEIELPKEEEEVVRAVVSGANQDMLVTRGMLGDVVGASSK